jgi:hypothetical protein
MAKKHKGQSTWDRDKSILGASKYSVGNLMFFQDPDRRIYLTYEELKEFIPTK